MSSLPLNRRRLLQATGVGVMAATVGVVDVQAAEAAAGTGPGRHRRLGVPVRPRPGAADRQPLAGQPEPDADLPAVRRRRPAAVQLPRQPPAVHQRRRGQRRLGRADVPVPHPHAGALPDRLGAGVRRARRHHLPGQGQLHGRRAGQVPGQQRRRRVQRRLPVRLPGVRLHRARGAARCPTATCPTTASTRPWPACSTCGATSATPRPATCCCALAGWVDCAHRPAELQPDAGRCWAPSSAA